MPRIQYLSQAGLYHYHDLGVPTKVVSLDEHSRNRLARDSGRPASGWLLPSRQPIRAIVMNKSPAVSGRPKTATMAPGPVDLTLMDSSDDDGDVQFVKANSIARQPVAKVSQPRRIPPSSGSKHASAKSGSKTTDASFSQNNRKATPVDLRSDTSSPRSSKPRRQEKAADPKSSTRTKVVARKSDVSGPPLRVEQSPPLLFNDLSSSGNDLPDLLRVPAPSASKKSPLLKSNLDESFGSMSSTLKRRLDAGSSVPAHAQPSKKVRRDGPSAIGRVCSMENSATAKQPAEPSSMPKAPLVSSPFSKAAANHPNLDASTPLGSKSVPPSISREKSNRQSSSPFRSQRSNGSTFPKRPNPIADLRVSQEKRSERQQNASQDDRGSPNNTHDVPTSSSASQPKPKVDASASEPRSLPGNRTDSPRLSVSKSTELRQAETVTGDSAPLRSSPERSGLMGQSTVNEAPPKPSRALELLNQRSTTRVPSGSKEKEAVSSDDDQGYGSLGSASGEDHDSSGAQSAALPIAPSPQDSANAPVSHPDKLVEDAIPKSTTAEGPRSELAELETHIFKKPQSNSNPTDEVAGLVTPTDKAPGNDIRMETAKPGAPELIIEPKSRPGSSACKAPDKAQDLLSGLETFKIQTQDKPPARPFEAATEAAEANDQLQYEALRAQSNPVFAVPQCAASTLKFTAAYARLPLATKVEKALGPYLEELAEDSEYWTSNSLMRARLSKELVAVPQAEHDEPTSFKHLKPLELRPAQKGDSKELIWGVERMANGKPTSSEKVMVTRQSFSADARDVPGYAHYVSITNNILAQNVKTLHCWPYFGDNFDCSEADNLREQYHLDIEGREQKLLRLRQAQKYEEYVESALTDLDCTWADVLRFLLDPWPTVGIESDALKAVYNRQEFCKEDFDRSSRRWITVLSSLPPSTPEKLACAAVFCENFQKLARFPLWHIAKRSDLCKLPDRGETSEVVTMASDELTCRICLRFNCPYHGELNERSDDVEDDESDSSSSSVVATDLVHPPKINHRTRVAFPVVQTPLGETDQATARLEKNDVRYWQNFQNKADERGPFYPCSHPGKACYDEEADCSCYAENLACEKFCGCNKECAQKFQGCSCSMQKYRGKRGPCFDDERCACWQLGRECDPDLCGGCGVCEVVDPVNKHDEDVPRGRCQNASIQRAVPKCTLLGDSGIHGLGLYACEDVRPNEFVGEYKGEIITKEEAERRGAVYEHQKLSYLFSLNKDQEIDSTYFGNKVRFINHASDKQGKANLYPRIIMVNTVHRIALYARGYINAGEELLFDYGPMFPDEQLGGKKSKKSAPHVRNANLVREFFEVEEDEDELGNRRAKRVSSGIGGRKAKRPRGGARPGAGRKPRRKEPEQQAVGKPMDEQRHESPFQDDEFADQDAGERLAAYNVADDRASDQMDVDHDAGVDAEEEDDGEYQESEEESEESEASESGEDEGDEADGAVRRQLGPTRVRSSWRTSARGA